MNAATENKASDEDIPATESIWVFILGDMSVFALFFCLYLHFRNLNPEIYQLAQQTLNPHFGSINTLFLLTSSWFMALAVAALRKGWKNTCIKLTVGGFVFGAAFAVLKVIEYHQKLEAGFSWQTNEFFLFYFLLTGIHFTHLLVGLGVLGYFIFSLRSANAEVNQIGSFELSTMYWHMVDLLWILIFPLLYLMP